MDKIDITLIQLLSLNSRLSYRELAEKLNLSINAVHKRIQALRESGIIHAFTAKISLMPLKTLTVMIFGSSGAHSFDDLRESLGNNSSVYWVTIASGNYLYVGGYLRNLSELENFVNFVKREGKMPNPVVGIMSNFGRTISTEVDTSLYPLDYQIIYALRNDSRRATSDVAEELGVSAKTVQRRLSRMIRENLIELSIEWYPDVSNDIITLCHVNLKTSIKKNEAYSVLTEKYSPNVLFTFIFGNIPNQLICALWTNSMSELKELQKNLEKEGVFESVVPNILYTGQILETWRDELLIEKGAPAKKGER